MRTDVPLLQDLVQLMNANFHIAQGCFGLTRFVIGHCATSNQELLPWQNHSWIQWAKGPDNPPIFLKETDGLALSGHIPAPSQGENLAQVGCMHVDDPAR